MRFGVGASTASQRPLSHLFRHISLIIALSVVLTTLGLVGFAKPARAAVLCGGLAERPNLSFGQVSGRGEVLCNQPVYQIRVRVALKCCGDERTLSYNWSSVCEYAQLCPQSGSGIGTGSAPLVSGCRDYWTRTTGWYKPLGIPVSYDVVPASSTRARYCL